MSPFEQSEPTEKPRSAAQAARVRVALSSLAVVLSFLIGAFGGLVAYRYAATKGKPWTAQPTPAPAPAITNLPPAVASAIDNPPPVVAAQTVAGPQPVVGTQRILRSVAFHFVDGNAQVALVLDQPIPYDAHELDQPYRVYLDLHGARLAPDLSGKTVLVNKAGVSKIRTAQSQLDTVRVVLDLDKRFDYSVVQETNPAGLVVKLTPHKKKR